MNVGGIRDFITRYRWGIALIVVLFFGYTVGKDRALRDNARDAAARQEAVQ